MKCKMFRRNFLSNLVIIVIFDLNNMYLIDGKINYPTINLDLIQT